MKIAVFFHTRLSGGRNVDTGASIDRSFGTRLFVSQMNALRLSGLLEAADIFVVGVNGPEIDSEFVSSFVPEKGGVVWHGEKAESLIPTMRCIQEWLPGHEDYAVAFIHSKGATKPNDPFSNAWRDCMMKHVIWDWRKCVADLETHDAVGCHWLNNSPNDPNAARWGSNSYFGGAFWWARADYLITLPPLPDKIVDRHSWYLPELWLGNGKPRIKDYHHCFPNIQGCTLSAMR